MSPISGLFLVPQTDAYRLSEVDQNKELAHVRSSSAPGEIG
jgi:hypothetical protein